MKALSIKQPWASMIARGEKTIETRTWRTKYRGPLLIVSSKKPAIKGLPAGMAMVVVDLVDCRPMTRGADEEAARCDVYPGAHAWVLENVREIPSFPVKGCLGFYEVELPSLTSMVPPGCR